MMPSSATPLLLLTLVAVLELIEASLVFLSGELNGTMMETPPATRFLGQQNRSAPVIAEIIFFDGDPCDIDLDIAGARGRIVLIPLLGQCSFEVHYDNFAGLGIAGFVMGSIYSPGGMPYNMRDGTTRLPPDLVPFTITVRDEHVEQSVARRSSPVLVALSPDANRWAATYASWPYIVFLRALPAFLFTVSFAMATRYLVLYGYILRERFLKEGRARWRGVAGALTFLWRNLAYHHSALIIKAMTTPLLALVAGLGGTLSSPIMSAPFHRVMLMQLSGFSFITIVMSSIIWNRIVFEISKAKKPSRFMKIVIGDFGVGAFVLYLLLLVSEVVFAVSLATYATNSKWFNSINGGVMATIQLVIGLQFLYSAVRFQSEVGRVAKDHNSDLRRYLDRVRINAFGLGVSILMYVVGTCMIVAMPAFNTPPGWTATWSIISVSHGMESVFLVRLFRPRSSTAKLPAPSTICTKASMASASPPGGSQQPKPGAKTKDGTATATPATTAQSRS